MENLVNEITAMIEVFNKNMLDNQKGNKAAGLRARKASLALEKLFKEYRKKSLESAKQ